MKVKHAICTNTFQPPSQPQPYGKWIDIIPGYRGFQSMLILDHDHDEVIVIKTLHEPDNMERQCTLTFHQNFGGVNLKKFRSYEDARESIEIIHYEGKNRWEHNQICEGKEDWLLCPICSKGDLKL